MNFKKIKAKLPPKEMVELRKRLQTLTPEEQAFVLGAEQSEQEKFQPSEWMVFIEKYGITGVCPSCGCKQAYKHSKGKKDKENRKYYGKPQFKCANPDCGKVYTPLADTIADNSSIPPEIQIALIYYFLNDRSLAKIKHNLKADYNYHLSQGAILAYRHKVLNAIMNTYEMPKLSGTVQVDETFFRENQKGVWELVNLIPTVVNERKPRTSGRRESSHLGTSGNEYSCVVVGISVNGADSDGYVAAVVTGLSKASSLHFEEYFSKYLDNVTYLCSDGYSAYHKYCEMNCIPHYIQPSEMRNIIRAERKAWEEEHNGEYLPDSVILEKHYDKRGLDRIENCIQPSFAEFERLKSEKHLTLLNIDRFHGQLKRHIEKNMTGVATKFLYLYIAFYVFRHNWAVANGDEPTSMADAEKIFLDLLQKKGNIFRSKDRKEKKITDLVKSSTKDTNKLHRLTEEMRKQSESKGFTFDKNDRLISFNKRKYFRDMGIIKIKEICKLYHIKGYTRTTNKDLLAKQICELPESDDIFLRLVASDSVHQPYMEDLVLLVKKAKEDTEDR